MPEIARSGIDFLTLMRMATSRPVEPIAAFKGSNDAPWWQLHSLYGLDYNNLYLPPFSQKFKNLRHDLTEILICYESGIRIDRCKLQDVCSEVGFLGSGSLMMSLRFAADRPLLPS